jgi:hypothetical protein
MPWVELLEADKTTDKFARVKAKQYWAIRAIVLHFVAYDQ